MAWLSGWSYRKAITVTNANADYQTKILIGKTSDAVGEDVDCGGHIADDFDDLRFTGADGTTLLDYWIESIVNSGVTKLATVWVQNNANPDTTLYMYYGGTEVAVSSGADTFIVFDDFERGNDGDAIGGDWTIDQGDVDISTEQAYGGTRAGKWIGGATQPMASIPATASDNIAVRYRYYKEDAGILSLYHGDGTTLMSSQFVDDENIRVNDGAAWVDTTLNCLKDAWGLAEWYNFDWTAKTVTLTVDGNTKAGIDISRASANYPNILWYRGYISAGNDSWLDELIVRKWAATEPSFAWGSEETPAAAGRSHAFIVNPYGLNIIRAGGR